MKISIVLDLANDYSVNSGVFRDSGNYVKEYANLCSATALYLLALQSEELSEEQRQELIKKCEQYIKLQEEIEQTRFSIESLTVSPKRKRKKNSKYDDEAFTSYNPPETENIIENQTIDVKEVILAAQETEQVYYSETDSDDSVNAPDSKRSQFDKSNLPKKKSPVKKKSTKVKVEFKPKPSTSQSDSYLVPFQSDNTVQDQTSLDIPVQEVKLESVQEVVVPVVVQAPDHQGYSAVPSTPVSQEYSAVPSTSAGSDPQPEVGYYNFSLELLKSFSERFKGKTWGEMKMVSTRKREAFSQPLFKPCEDFLCPPEERLQEWFPTILDGRLRAKALDPYGFMKAETNQYEQVYYRCQDEKCHATLVVRKVAPDPEGNEVGLYGCLTHQHPIPNVRRSEIVFRTKAEAYEFRDKHIDMGTYFVKKGFRKDCPYKQWWCRRNHIQAGYHKCESTFQIKPTFAEKSLKSPYLNVPTELRPYSVAGIFYHSHENDPRYHRTEGGGWSTNNCRNNIKPKKQSIRVRNGLIFPISARNTGITIEEILNSKRRRKLREGNLKRSKGKK